MAAKARLCQLRQKDSNRLSKDMVSSNSQWSYSQNPPEHMYSGVSVLQKEFKKKEKILDNFHLYPNARFTWKQFKFVLFPGLSNSPQGMDISISDPVRQKKMS